MSLTRHTLNDLLCDGWIVFAPLESFVEQFNTEIGNLLAGAFSDLLFDLAAPKFNVRNRCWQNGAAFLKLLVTQRLSSFGNPDNLHEIVRGDGGSRFAPRMSSKRDSALRSSLSRL